MVRNDGECVLTLSETWNRRQRLEFRPMVAVGAVIGELVSVTPFPVLWENTGKFVEFRAGDGDRRPPSEWKFNRLQTEFPKHRIREIVRLKQGKQR